MLTLNAPRALIVAAALGFAGAAEAQQSPDASQAQDLSNCAGAVAAYGGFDVVSYPAGATGEWGRFLGVLIERMRTEPGIEGMTGRYAASAARSHWREQPRAAQEAEANACRARFGNE